MRNTAIFRLVLLGLALAFVGCITIEVDKPPTGREGSPGGQGVITTEAEASKLADEIIARDFPNMAGAEKTSESHSIEGRQTYEFIYMGTIKVESNGGTAEISREVIIYIDKDTGEQIVEVSR